MNEQAYTILRVRPTGRARRAPGGSTASAALVASEPTVESLSPSEVADARRAPDADVAPVLPMKLVQPRAHGHGRAVPATGAGRGPFAIVAIAVLAVASLATAQYLFAQQDLVLALAAPLLALALAFLGVVAFDAIRRARRRRRQAGG